MRDQPRGPGKLLGVVPFADEPAVGSGTVIGSGLDGRLVLDLTTLTSNSLITSNDRFFIRKLPTRSARFSSPLEGRALMVWPRLLTC